MLSYIFMSCSLLFLLQIKEHFCAGTLTKTTVYILISHIYCLVLVERQKTFYHKSEGKVCLEALPALSGGLY